MTDEASRPLRVFFCHSSGDKPIVRELYQKLSSEGWIDVWLDEVKLLPGQDWDYEIERALDSSDAVIVALSTGSVSKEGYVQRELRAVLDIALEKSEGTIYILPLRLDNCPRPRRLRSIHGVDYFPENLRAWAYERIIESLKARAKHLGLSTNTLESTLIPNHKSSSFPGPQVSQSAAPSPYVSTKLSAPIPQQGAATKRKNVWFYGRLMVVLLLILGLLVFQTWSIYWAFVWLLSGTFLFLLFAIPPVAFVALSLITLARLFPSRLSAHTAIVRLERLITGIACIFIAGSISLALATVQSSSRGLGFWLSSVGVDLAAINILFELRSTMQKGEKLPWWAWLLAISIALPWLVFLVAYLWPQSR